MTSSVTVFLVRHGRTSLNAQGVLRGRIDVPLDAVGRSEAVALGVAFAGMPLAAVITSPLRRARETAAPIVDSTRAPLMIDDDLADRDYGPWAGHPLAEIETSFGSPDLAPGVEQIDTFTQRVVAAVERAADRATSAPVVVVAHDAVNRHLLASLVPALGTADVISQRTGCWNELVRSERGWAAPIVDSVADASNRR
jgi:probable phosphoglycerate mutase